MNIMDYIEIYVEKEDYQKLILSDDIFIYIKKRETDLTREKFNTYLSRYTNKNKNLVRYQKGIYYKTKRTPFGNVGIDYANIVSEIYLMEDEKIIGYETGPSFFNKIGLTTQMSKKTYIVTNNNRRKIKDLAEEIVLIKPIKEINNDNYRYFQFLDLLNNKFDVQIEAADYLYKLENFINKFDLNYKRLMAFAYEYNNNEIYKKLAQLAKGV